MAADRVKTKLEADFNDNKNKTENLTAFQSKLSDLKSKVGDIDLMDYKNIKQIYEESVKIKKSLNAEFNEVKKNPFDPYRNQLSSYCRPVTKIWRIQFEAAR